jgi:serine/threonine protein kinase
MQNATDIGNLRFGKYRAIKEIGRGATSSVYLAEEDVTGGGSDAFGQDWNNNSGAPRRVAVKVVDFTDDRSKLSRRFRKLFATEAAVTAQFDHPNIARVFDWHVEDKRAYLIMELVEGIGLDQFVTMDKLLPMHRVVGIVFKVAMALDYAHRRGIVHRDIKPANVMLTKDDEVKLMDFGLALNIRKNVNIDSTFINGLGSPSYMSPEQIKGYTLNHQTDLYSLGVMFYQLLTGRLPFRGPNTAALVYKIINTEAVPVTQLNPDLPELTNKVIVRALEKDLYSRYRLGADMAKDLSSVRFQILQEGQVLPDETKWKAVRGLPLMGKLDDVDVWELLRLSAWRILPPATVIMKDGEPGKSFGFILEGEVEVEKGDRALAKLTRGDIVGEVGFLHSEEGRRTASVTTLNQVTFLEINPAAFAFATEELVTEIRRIAVDALVNRMGEANRLARHFSPAAVHPSPLPEGEVEAPVAAAVVARGPAEAPGWSVFAKPQRAGLAAALGASEPPQVSVPATSPVIAPPAPATPAFAPASAPAYAQAPLQTGATGRTSTVVVQPLPASAAAVIAQMALTQHPKGAPALQPFELGPESTGDMAPALPVSELPADAVLTTDLGAHFDSMSGSSTTELAGGFVARGNATTTGDMTLPLDQPAFATSEMAPDFGQLPRIEEPQMLAPEFDIHARTGRGQTQARQSAYAATTDMAASFRQPDNRPALASRSPGGVPQRSLMPTTRPIADQSTQELAGHFLAAPGAGPEADPMDQLGRDMFPPLSPAGAGGRDRFSDDEPYEATQMLDPGQFSVPLPPLDGGFGDDEPYEATQAIDSGAFGMPQSPFDSDGRSDLPSSAGDEVTVEFDGPAPDEFDRTMEIAGGFLTAPPEPETPLPELFPPLKP